MASAPADTVSTRQPARSNATPANGCPSAAATRPLKVLYTLWPSRTYAGIERVIDEICSELAETYGARYEVDVLFTSQFKNFPIDDRRYNIIRKEGRRWKLLRVVREVVTAKEYDLVVVPQVEATVLFWLASLGSKARFILYLHGNPKLEIRSYKARILFWLMGQVVVSRLAGVFGTSPRQLDAFKTMFPSKAPHYWTPNPVRRFAETPPREAQSDIVTFVNVGRFAYQKGQDILLRVFARLHEQRPNARLRLVGYGDDEAQLRADIERLGLSDAAWIEHHPTNPQVALATSDVYISTSRWEGWSLAICEALRFGLPVVSTDCEFGPSDILTDPRLGQLAPLPDEDALLAAMIRYCDDPQREFAAYRKDYIDRFSVERVVHVHADALALVAH